MTQKEKQIEETQVITRSSMKEIEKKKKNISTKKNKFNVLDLFLVIGTIAIIIPTIIFAWILLSAANTDGPILGNRFENDLNPSITSDQISTLKTNLSKVNDIEKVEINLISATLRINLDVTDSIQGVYIDRIGNDKLLENLEDELESNEEKVDQVEDSSSNKPELQDDVLSKIAIEAYQMTIDNLDKNTYFTSNKDKKMYDLEIHVYNSLDKVENDDFAYLTLIKSSNMLNPSLQLVSEPIDSALAESLIKETENRLNPTPTPALEGDINVSGSDIQNDPSENSEGE